MTSWLKRYGAYQIDSRKVGEWTVLEVTGKFTAGEPEKQFRQAIDSALNDGDRHIVIDLSGSHLADDSIATAATEAHHKARLKGAELRCVVPPGRAGSYYHMAGLELSIPTFARLGGAIDI